MSSTEDTVHEAVRVRAQGLFYWCVMGSSLVTERVGRLGYDAIVLDQQHGEFSGHALTAGIQAVKAAGSPALVRVSSNDPVPIGEALDRGAAGVVVPMVRTAADARDAVEACSYPPAGVRSYGPLRADRFQGLDLPAIDRQTVCIPMIETLEAVDCLESICALDGVDALYVGPSDLRIAIGGRRHDDPAVDTEFAQLLTRILDVAHAAGIGVGIHTPSGVVAASRLEQVFDFASVASDVNHLVAAAAGHLHAVRAPDAS